MNDRDFDDLMRSVREGGELPEERRKLIYERDEVETFVPLDDPEPVHDYKTFCDTHPCDPLAFWRGCVYVLGMYALWLGGMIGIGWGIIELVKHFTNGG